MLVYLHPVVAGLVTALLFYTGFLGLRSRSDRRHRRTLLARHAQVAPIMYGVMVVSWVGGLASTYWLRPDRDVSLSTHLQIGCAMLVCLSIGVWTSRNMRRPALRSLHPFVGAAAMLLAAAQVFFGLQITP